LAHEAGERLAAGADRLGVLLDVRPLGLRFLLNSESGTLFRHGAPVAVGYRGMLLLQALLKRGGEALTKADLMDAVWPGTAVEERARSSKSCPPA
jgi:hypothetical protein